MKNFVIAAVAIVLLIAGLVFYRNSSTQNAQAPTSEAPTDLVEVRNNPPGDSVVIPHVVLSEPGFVMIHESDNGRTGAIVMTGDYLPAGESKDVVVHTGIETKSGESYFAMLHADNGNGKYDNPGVDPPVVLSGEIVQEEFSIE